VQTERLGRTTILLTLNMETAAAAYPGPPPPGSRPAGSTIEAKEQTMFSWWLLEFVDWIAELVTYGVEGMLSAVLSFV
jgi:hypothetical protein